MSANLRSQLDVAHDTVDAMVKAGLLDLVAAAGDAGWSTRRAALLLGLDLDRVRRWAKRRAIGELADRRPGGGVHAILPAEREAILTLAETWGPVDRSLRKLALRGSRLGLVHVSESSVLRVLRRRSCPTREAGP